MIVRDQHIAGARRWAFHGESLMELTDWLTTAPRKWSANSSTSCPTGSLWDLGTGYAGALQLAARGWQEGAEELAQVTVTMPREGRINKTRIGFAGYTPDIARYVAGDPAHMIDRGHSLAHRPVVSLAVGIGGTAAVTAKQMMNYGKAMLSIIDKLEAVGRRAEVTACWTSADMEGKKHRATVSWLVKAPEDSLDLASLAFSLAHPAAMRRLGFAAYERSSLPEMYGYGRTVKTEREDLVDLEGKALILPGLSSDGSRCDTLEGALSFAIEQINKAAGETLVEVE